MILACCGLLDGNAYDSTASPNNPKLVLTTSRTEDNRMEAQDPKHASHSNRECEAERPTFVMVSRSPKNDQVGRCTGASYRVFMRDRPIKAGEHGVTSGKLPELEVTTYGWRTGRVGR
jgi:hypothetical protein